MRTAGGQVETREAVASSRVDPRCACVRPESACALDNYGRVRSETVSPSTTLLRRQALGLVLFCKLVAIMPAMLRTTACRSLVASGSARLTAVRYNATVAAPPTSSSALFMSGPAAQKVQSEARVVKYAGKKKPITPVSWLGERYGLALISSTGNPSYDSNPPPAFAQGRSPA